ncbi:MAG TPA: hypothetical protein ENF30_01085 [Candidatus Desulfofervidus auxilii]|uniref:RNA 2'-phosphotransferase n=1 Tax=Desulfofervidus auxilii TaxID=1621989 RepID=A0A7V0I9V6_DESA2|nr:hypothetical protein [Candidatus Desulfofervidus auxilii]
MKGNYQRKLAKISKLMKYILVYRPDEFGLIVDEEGFVLLKDLLKAINEEKDYSFVRLSHIMDIVNFFERDVFEIKDKKIRAIQRHFELLPVNNTPKILYTPVRPKAYSHVLKQGLIPAKYAFLPLTTDKELALRIGKRRDKEPIIIEIHAHKAIKDNINFYCLNKLLYLVKEMPSQYISGPPLEKVTKVEKTVFKTPSESLFLTPKVFYTEKINRAKRYARKKAKRRK